MVGLHRHIAHVFGGGIDILRCDISPVQALHIAAQSAKIGFGLHLGRVTYQDGFPPAQVKPRRGGLEGHAARQAQAVDERLFFGRVVPDARAAQRRAQCGVMDDGNALQPRRTIIEMDDLFVLVLLHAIENR